MAQDSPSPDATPMTTEDLVDVLAAVDVDIPVSADVPSADELLQQGDMTLVLESYESGGGSVEERERFDREEWTANTRRSNTTWSSLATQTVDARREKLEISDDDQRELVRLHVPFWWPEKEEADADPRDTTWARVYGEEGEAKTLAVVDMEQSADSGAWYIEWVQGPDGRWKHPDYLHQPKSIVDIVRKEGEAGLVDEESIRPEDCYEGDSWDSEYDAALGIEQAAERLRQNRIDETYTADLDLEGIEEEHGPVASDAVTRGIAEGMSAFKRLTGEDPAAREVEALYRAAEQAVVRAAQHGDIATRIQAANEIVEEEADEEESVDDVLAEGEVESHP